MHTTKNFSITLVALTKAVFFVLLLYVLCLKLFIENDVQLLFSELLTRLWGGNSGLLLLALLLMPLNWMIEVQKLYVLQAGAVDWRLCGRAVLSGISLGVVTPARLGEYAGRLLVVEKRFRGTTMVATFLMSLSQLSVTLGLGLVAFILLMENHTMLNKIKLTWVVVSIVVGLVIVVICYVSWSSLKSRIRESRLGSNFAAALTTPPSVSMLTLIMGLSTVRYLVYMFQYVILLLYFGVDFPFGILALHVVVIFLVQSLVPLPPVASLVSRSSVAVLILAPLGINEMVIMTASIAIWIINLMIPAFCGMGIIMRLKATSKT